MVALGPPSGEATAGRLQRVEITPIAPSLVQAQRKVGYRASAALTDNSIIAAARSVAIRCLVTMIHDGEGMDHDARLTATRLLGLEGMAVQKGGLDSAEFYVLAGTGLDLASRGKKASRD